MQDSLERSAVEARPLSVDADALCCQDNPIISIVVPVYNVEQYLDRCMETLVAQTFTQIEIILVDDGATDSSPELCDAWARRDNRVVVIHQENGGLSAARNAGVARARGSYIGFVDPDDYVELTMYEHLYRNLQKESADIAICGAYNSYPNGMVEAAQRTGYYVCDAEEALGRSLDGKDIMVTAVTRLYPKDLAQRVLFPVGKIQEDAFTAVDFLLDARRVVIDLEPLYYYEHREGTLSSKPYTKGVTWDLIEAWERNYQMVMDQFPRLEKQVSFRRYWAYFDVLDSMFVEGAQDDPEAQRTIVTFLRAHMTDILRNPYFRTTRKVGAAALALSVNLYAELSRAQRRRMWK